MAGFLLILFRVTDTGRSMLRILPLDGLRATEIDSTPVDVILPLKIDSGSGDRGAPFMPRYIIVRENDDVELGRSRRGRIALVDEEMKRIRVYDLALPTQRWDSPTGAREIRPGRVLSPGYGSR